MMEYLEAQRELAVLLLDNELLLTCPEYSEAASRKEPRRRTSLRARNRPHAASAPLGMRSRPMQGLSGHRRAQKPSSRAVVEPRGRSGESSAPTAPSRRAHFE